MGNFSKALANLHDEIHECEICHAMTDKNHSQCSICRDEKRDSHLLCVVEDYLDMLSIERTGVYRGRYHVLGGVVSPIAGTLPDKLNYASLFERVGESIDIEEVIIATNPNIE